MRRADNESQVNHEAENAEPDTFLNLRTHKSAASPKNIMIDSIRMNLDCVRMAVSNRTMKAARPPA